MSWDNVWPLPRARYTRSEVDEAVAKTLRELRLKRPVDDDSAWPDEELDGDDEAESFNYTVVIPRALLEEHGDQPADEDEYECEFTVAPNILGDDSERWEVCVHSNDAQNREASMAVAHVAARVSVLLGGPDEPEPL